MTKDWFEKQHGDSYLQMLLDHKNMDINARDHAGETPLFRFIAHAAHQPSLHDSIYDFISDSSSSSFSLIPSVQIFVDAGADVTVRNAKGASLLHRMAEKKEEDNPYLAHARRIEEGTDVADEKVELFKWLMEQGCDVAWENDEQRTALDVAAAVGNREVLELFRGSKRLS